MTMRCPSCGMTNQPGARFCSSCGTPLPEVRRRWWPLAAIGTALVGIVAVAVAMGGQHGVSVPSVVGMPQDDAVQILDSAGFGKVVIETGESPGAAGTVIDISPGAGSKVSTDQSITLTVAASAANEPQPSTTTTLPPDDVTTTTSTVDAGATTTSAPVSVIVQPIGAQASATRPAVSQLRCGGSNRFDAELLIDGDVNTGWGASVTDGSGEYVDITFDGEIHLTEVGMTPGYLRVAPRYDQGCADVLAFDYNRFIDAVEYRFDDGSTVVQYFEQVPTMQTIDVDVVTHTVRITVLRTTRTVDDDTIISEAFFMGYKP
jgi:hypothetical protein